MIISLKWDDHPGKVQESLSAFKEHEVNVIPKMQATDLPAHVEGSLFGIGEDGLTVDTDAGLVLVSYSDIRHVSVQ